MFTGVRFIGIGLMLVQQLSGINAIMFYSGTILQTVASSSAEANDYATGMQGLQVVVTFCSVRDFLAHFPPFPTIFGCRELLPRACARADRVLFS